MSVAAIILTYNEEKHIRRCIASLKGVVNDVFVVDSYSTDNTVSLAKALGAKVLHNEWKNYATQFNWGIEQVRGSAEWILRIDADEYLTAELRNSLIKRFYSSVRSTNGFYFGRRMTFQGRLIKYGGVFPVRVLRLFRAEMGRCENRWMDEHISVDGRTETVSGELIDDNLNSLTWWTEKHNQYASREAVDILNLEYGFMPHETVASLTATQAGVKRWIKENVYFRLPGGVRALAYFVYRYFLRLGFLDGGPGTSFHVLQGFWYRYLVDAKVSEVRRFVEQRGVDVSQAVWEVLGIDVR